MELIKISGKLLHDEATLDHLAAAMLEGRNVVVLHGAGPQLDEAWAGRGWPVVRVDGLRVTSTEQAALVHDVLRQAGQDLLAELQARGAEPQHIVLDHAGVHAKPHPDPRLDRVGVAPVLHAAVQGPAIVTLLAGDPAPLNVNVDDLVDAAVLAWHPESVQFATDVPAILDGGQPVPELNPATLEDLTQRAVVKDGMLVKVRAAMVLAKQTNASIRIGHVRGPGTRVVATASSEDSVLA